VAVLAAGLVSCCACTRARARVRACVCVCVRVCAPGGTGRGPCVAPGARRACLRPRHLSLSLSPSLSLSLPLSLSLSLSLSSSTPCKLYSALCASTRATQHGEGEGGRRPLPAYVCPLHASLHAPSSTVKGTGGGRGPLPAYVCPLHARLYTCLAARRARLGVDTPPYPPSSKARASGRGSNNSAQVLHTLPPPFPLPETTVRRYFAAR
jgi:hypothetical protein